MAKDRRSGDGVEPFHITLRWSEILDDVEEVHCQRQKSDQNPRENVDEDTKSNREIRIEKKGLRC
jgi:hypothetical protein